MIIKKIYKLLIYFFYYGFSSTFIKLYSYTYLNIFIKFKKNYHHRDHSFYKKDYANQGDAAILGCGNFSFSNIAFFLSQKNKNFLRACFDINLNKAIILGQFYKAYLITNKFEYLIKDPKINKYFIATNHFSHFTYMEKILKLNSKAIIHVEKPHVVNFDQYKRLKKILILNPKANIYLGFNRPHSKLFNKFNKYFNKAYSYRMKFEIQGHILDKNHWYYNKEEGGRIIGNLSHWIDLCIHIVGSNNIYPYEIHPIYSDPHQDEVNLLINFKKYNSKALIEFKAKDNDLLGVKEKLDIKFKDKLIEIKDFNNLSIFDGSKRKTIYNKTRKYLGHKENIINSYINTKSLNHSYILDTAKLFLSVKKAFDENKIIKVYKN